MGADRLVQALEIFVSSKFEPRAGLRDALLNPIFWFSNINLIFKTLPAVLVARIAFGRSCLIGLM